MSFLILIPYTFCLSWAIASLYLLNFNVTPRLWFYVAFCNIYYLIEFTYMIIPSMFNYPLLFITRLLSFAFLSLYPDIPLTELSRSHLITRDFYEYNYIGLKILFSITLLHISIMIFLNSYYTDNRNVFSEEVR